MPRPASRSGSGPSGWPTATSARSRGSTRPRTRWSRRSRVGAAPTGVAVDDHWVWVTNRLDHSVTRIDPGDGATQNFAVGASPLGVVAAHGSIWVVDGGDSLVERIDPASGAVTRTVAVGSDPTSIAATPDGNALWVVNTGSGTVFRIDDRDSDGDRGPTGRRPAHRRCGRTGGAVWVAVSSTNEILRLDPDSAQIVGRTALQATPQALTDEGGRVAFTADAPAGSHRGGALRVVTGPGEVPDSPDPTFWQWGLDWTPQTTNDPLVTYKRVGGPDALTFVPDLAEDIPDSPDGGLTWTFRLRAGLRYSDGRPVRAGRRPPLVRARRHRRLLTPGRDVREHRDPRLVGLWREAAVRPGPWDHDRRCAPGRSLSISSPPIRTFRTVSSASRSCRRTRRLPQSARPSRRPARTRSPRFVPGRSVRLVRNPLFHAWSADAQPDGNADEIDIAVSTAPDPSAEVESGAADVLQIETEAGRAPRAAPDHRSGPAPRRPGHGDLARGHEHEPPAVRRPRVREAINLATDRDALVDAWGGPLTATVTCQLVPPGFAGYERYCPWTVDPAANGNWLGPDLARARALIDQAGVRGTAVTVLGGDDGGQHVGRRPLFHGRSSTRSASGRRRA